MTLRHASYHFDLMAEQQKLARSAVPCCFRHLSDLHAPGDPAWQCMRGPAPVDPPAHAAAGRAACGTSKARPSPPHPHCVSTLPEPGTEAWGKPPARLPCADWPCGWSFGQRMVTPAGVSCRIGMVPVSVSRSVCSSLHQLPVELSAAHQALS